MATGIGVNTLDVRDVRLGRDDWLRYARGLEAVDGRQARLLRNKIAAGLAAVPASGDDTVVLVLTRLDRVLLRDLDQQELDMVLAAARQGAEKALGAAG